MLSSVCDVCMFRSGDVTSIEAVYEYNAMYIYIYVVVTTLARCMFWVLPCLGSCAVRFLSVEIITMFSRFWWL